MSELLTQDKLSIAAPPMAPMFGVTLNISYSPFRDKAHCALGTFCPVGCYRNACAAKAAGVKHLWTCGGDLSPPAGNIRRRICPAILPSWARTAVSNAANFAGERHKNPHRVHAIRLKSVTEKAHIHWKTYVLRKSGGCRAKRVPTIRRQAGEVRGCSAYSGSLHLRFGRLIKRPPEKCG